MGNNPTVPKNPAGRPKGSVNKATANARAAIGEFVEGNVARLNGLLDAIEAEDGSRAAWDCIVSVLEYHVPKLARTELTGKDGGAIEVARTEDNAALDHYRAKLLASTQSHMEH